MSTNSNECQSSRLVRVFNAETYLSAQKGAHLEHVGIRVRAPVGRAAAAAAAILAQQFRLEFSGIAVLSARVKRS
jgi:hypothetical protein